MNRAQLPTKRRLPSNITVSDDETVDDIASTTISKGSMPVPSPKPKPRHHRDFDNELHATDHVTNSDLHTKSTSDSHTKSTSDSHTKTTGDLHTKTTGGDLHSKTTSDLHTKITGDVHNKTTDDLHSKTTSDVHTKTTGDVHTVGPLTHINTTSSTTMGWSTPSPKLKPKLVSSVDSITSIDTITTPAMMTTSGQAKIRTSDVHVKPLVTTSELQTTATTGSIVQAYYINTNIDDDATNTTGVKLLAKPHVARDPSTTSSNVTTSDLPLMADSHTKIDTDDKFHVKTTDNVHTGTTKHTLDVVSDHVVEETDIGWSPTHRVTTNDETVNEQRKRLKGMMLLLSNSLSSLLCRD